MVSAGGPGQLWQIFVGQYLWVVSRIFVVCLEDICRRIRPEICLQVRIISHRLSANDQGESTMPTIRGRSTARGMRRLYTLCSHTWLLQSTPWPDEAEKIYCEFANTLQASHFLRIIMRKLTEKDEALDVKKYSSHFQETWIGLFGLCRCLQNAEEVLAPFGCFLSTCLHAYSIQMHYGFSLGGFRIKSD